MNFVPVTNISPKLSTRDSRNRGVLPALPGKQNRQGGHQHNDGALGVGHAEPAHHTQEQRVIGVHRIPGEPGQGRKKNDLHQIDGKGRANKFAQVPPLAEQGDKGQGEYGEIQDPQEVCCIRHKGLIPDAEAVEHVSCPKDAHHPVEYHVNPLSVADHKAQESHCHQHQKAQRRGQGVVPPFRQEKGQHIQHGLDHDQEPHDPGQLIHNGPF